MNRDVDFARSEQGNSRLLTITGEIDLSAAGRFSHELGTLVTDAGDKGLVDLSGVTFIDSSGVRELLAARRAAAALGAQLLLVNPSAACRRVLEISGVWNEFGIAADSDVAPQLREALMRLNLDVASLSEGRRFVARTLRAWEVDEDTIEPILLVANELVANAIVHAHSAPVLSLEESGADLLLRVADESPDLPVTRQATLDSDGGRGLILVEALSDQWGIDTNDSGKIVWVTFAGAFG
jgi:anti-anti-sigma factor